MSEQVYQARIKELEEYVAKLKNIRRKQDKEFKALQEEHAQTVKERDTVKAKYEAAPSELAEEVSRLKGEIRTRDHKSKFTALAKASKVREDALEDLWSLTGWKADADEVNEEAMSQAIRGAVEKRPYLLVQEEAQVEAPEPPPMQPPPAAGKGVPLGSFVVSPENLRDPVWIYQNQKAMSVAKKEGRLATKE
jgi:hypothetical protein